MTVFLRFVGVSNAAVWFGGHVAILFVALTGFFSPEMEKLFNSPVWKYYAGGVAQIIFQQFFVLQFWCGGIALAHLTAEALYLGQPFSRFRVVLLIATIALTLFGGLVASPKLKELRAAKYSQERQRVSLDAEKKLHKWHRAAEAINLLVIIGVGTYFWFVIQRADSTRLASLPKFRS